MGEIDVYRSSKVSNRWDLGLNVEQSMNIGHQSEETDGHFKVEASMDIRAQSGTKDGHLHVEKLMSFKAV